MPRSYARARTSEGSAAAGWGGGRRHSPPVPAPPHGRAARAGAAGWGGVRCYAPAVPDPANGRGAVPIMNRQPLTVAVVGATGVVGRTMIQILNEREFPVGQLRLLASGRSAGRTVSIDGRTLEIGEAVADAFDGVDIALFSAGADASRELAPAAGARGGAATAP